MRSVGVAYLLWVLLPCTGAHRFYSGRIGTGFLWLFTGGLVGMGWLVDAFLIPGIVREVNAEQRSRYGHQQFVANAASPGAAAANRVIYCTQCGSPMQVPADAVGMQYACPSCRTVLEVPA